MVWSYLNLTATPPNCQEIQTQTEIDLAGYFKDFVPDRTCVFINYGRYDSTEEDENGKQIEYYYRSSNLILNIAPNFCNTCSNLLSKDGSWSVRWSESSLAQDLLCVLKKFKNIQHFVEFPWNCVIFGSLRSEVVKIFLLKISSNFIFSKFEKLKSKEQ